MIMTINVFGHIHILFGSANIGAKVGWIWSRVAPQLVIKSFKHGPEDVCNPHLWLPSPPPNTSRHGIPRLLTTPSGDPHLAPVLGKQFIHAVAREVSVIIISETPPGSASLSMPIHCTQIVVVTDDGFCSRSWPEILVSRTFTLPSGMLCRICSSWCPTTITVTSVGIILFSLDPTEASVRTPVGELKAQNDFHRRPQITS